MGTGNDSNIGRISVNIRFFRQVERGEKLTEPPSTPLPPLVLFATRRKYGWSVYVTFPDKRVRKYRSLTWMGAIRKSERILRKSWDR